MLIACSSDEPEVMITPTITGTVLDQNDGAYDNVEVRLLQSGTEVSSVKSDPSGAFTFSSLNDGTYEIEIDPPLATNVQGSNPISLAVDMNGAAADFTVNLTEVSGYIIGKDLDPYGEIKNQDRLTPQDQDEIYAVNVFSDQQLVPIYAPDGHQLTFSEWKEAEGTARFRCNGRATYYEMEFSGLIPNGVYTVWISPLVSRKTVQSVWTPSTDMLGLGALGGSGGLKNIVTADELGIATLTGDMGNGALSNFGELVSCALTSSKGLALILDYHIDGNTYGDTAGPDHTEVGHMIFLF